MNEPMKNLGTFDQKAFELFESSFSETENFSEATELYDFARCQRPDGTFYGTGGQCRKGSPTSEKAEKSKTDGSGRRPRAAIDAEAKQVIQQMKGAKGLELLRLKNKLQELKTQARETRRDVATKRRERKESQIPQTREQAQATRRKAAAKALRDAKLPSSPASFKREVNRRLEGSEEFASAQAKAKEADKQLNAAGRAVRIAQDKLEKDRFNKDLRDDWQKKTQAANRAYTERERAMGEVRRLTRNEETRLNSEVNKVAAGAIAEARKREPIVGSDMGSPRRLGDADIQTSPRD